ncbi:MAG: cytochrome P450, partial [Anaerolineaceae bacterium]|nr:cytochrome P450 [Anaerolineaceae bacterium]
LLHEILRLEPVVGRLYRRAATDLQIETGGETVTIPAGAMIDMDLGAINADARVVGAEPLNLNADRPMEKGVPGSVMGFGSGPHRCAGEHIAIAETDVFLQKLLAIPGLTIEKAPKLGHNDTIKGYELREFWLTIQR